MGTFQQDNVHVMVSHSGENTSGKLEQKNEGVL